MTDDSAAAVPVSALRAILARYQNEREITGVWLVARLEALCNEAAPVVFDQAQATKAAQDLDRALGTAAVDYICAVCGHEQPRQSGGFRANEEGGS